MNCTENSENDELIDGSLFESDDDLKWSDCDDELRCLYDQVLVVFMRGVYANNRTIGVGQCLHCWRTIALSICSSYFV